MALFKKATSPTDCFGLYFSNQQLSIAIPQFDNQKQLIALESIQDTVASDITEKLLRDIRDNNALTKKSCYWTLSSNQYQVLLIDRPDVKPSEYGAAALWQAKEMLDYPIEDCVVDVFLPAEEIVVHKDKLYVVAARKSFLLSIVEKFEILEMPITSINIEEFALRNLVSQLLDQQPTAIVTFDGSDYFINIFSNNNILFSRRIQTNLVIELYRSLDFYTTALRQKSLTALYMQNISNSIEQEIKSYFKNKGYEIVLKYFDQTLKKLTNIDEQNMNAVFAVGAALQCQIDTEA